MKYGYLLLVIFCLANACSSQQQKEHPRTGKPDGQEIISRDFTYTADTTHCIGFIALPVNEKPTATLMIVPEWWGIGAYEKRRAQQLAEQGYVAFVVDMYGNGTRLSTPDSAGKWARPFYQDFILAQSRFHAALLAVKQLPEVDTNRIGAIGYCFGGTQVLNMARMGEPLQVVVSFHGGLQCAPIEANITDKAAVLVCNGAIDQSVSAEDIKHFKSEMTQAGFILSFKDYANATHAFTNPEADSYALKFKLPIAYNPTADTASWKDMLSFLKQYL